jgi:hypothetical protein
LGSRVETAHPILQGIDVVAFQDATPSVTGVPGWAHVILGTRDGPLISEGRLEGHPVVSLTFDPMLSGIDKSLAFPLLISNSTSFLLAEAESAGSPTAAEKFDPAESDIAPRPVPTFQTTTTPILSSGSAVNDLWPWLAASTVVLLGLEWLVFARRG